MLTLTCTFAAYIQQKHMRETTTATYNIGDPVVGIWNPPQGAQNGSFACRPSDAQIHKAPTMTLPVETAVEQPAADGSVHPAVVSCMSIDKIASGAGDSCLPPPPPGPIDILDLAAKEDELRPSDARNPLAVKPAVPERCQLEDFTPFSTCHLWKLMMSFYDRQGVESWAQGIVPHFITSNTFIAKKYSSVLVSYFRDAMRANSSSRVCFIWISVTRAGATDMTAAL